MKGRVGSGDKSDACQARLLGRGHHLGDSTITHRLIGAQMQFRRRVGPTGVGQAGLQLGWSNGVGLIVPI